jgi:hypothetical protein
LWKLCGTQECHALKNRPYFDWCLVVMRHFPNHSWTFLSTYIHSGMAVHFPHIEDLNVSEFQHLEHLLPTKILRHSSALLWCKLKDTLTCSSFSRYSRAEGRDLLQSRSDNQNIVYSAAKSQHSTTTKTLQTNKCGNFLKCPCIKNVMWLNSSANSTEMPLTLVLQSYCVATLYSSAWQDVK